MIPLKLTLRNFMCYRQMPPLDFRSIHLACLSGDNGNGKSALVDAMTWALWGKARDSAISSDDLIYAQAPEMEVEFDFMAGPQVYRIIRKRARAKKVGGAGQSVLELQAETAEGFKPIGGTIDQTQHKITDEVLHMDYDTFINSAYLRQGHADEFTCQTPAMRKQVLANILRLGFYDELESDAKQLQRQHEASRLHLDMALSDIAAELARKPALEADLLQQDADLARLSESFARQEACLKELTQERERLERKHTDLQAAESLQRDFQREITLWGDQVKTQTARVRDDETLLSSRPDIEAGYARLLEGRKVNEQMFQDSRRLAGLNQRQHELELAITHAEQALLRERALAQARADDFDTRSRKLPGLRSELEKTEAALRKHHDEEELLRARKETLQAMQEQVGELQHIQARLRQDLAENADKSKLLSGQKEAKCPLCERDLEMAGLALIQSKFAAEWQAKSQLLKEVETNLAAKKALLDTLKKDVARSEADLEQRKSALHNKAAVLNRQITECVQAAEELSRARQAVAQVQGVLDARAFGGNERQALAALQAEVSALGYRPEQHEQVRQAVAALEVYHSRKARLDEAEKGIEAERQNLEQLAAALQGSQRRLVAEDERIKQLTQELVQLPETRRQCSEAEAALGTIRQQRDLAQKGVWTLRQKLADYAELEVKAREKGQQRNEAARLEGIYGELARAFGKTGVQALLIEQALPEIEDEANRLLARMTDNRMHLQFVPQKPTRKGDLVETLDIHIGDDLGTRPYEMFSGGEAFRINFAIRIALSKVLAKRAGAPLPTLIIDEGFGTQDAGGIEKLKEAINSIQDDFQKILVITHIEELREAFPTRIDVAKGPDGATVRVS